MYLVEEGKLRGVKHFLSHEKKIDALRKCRLIILQHLLDDTKEFVGHLLSTGVCVDSVIGKTYSTTDADIEYFREKGVDAYCLSDSHQDDQSMLLTILVDALRKAETDGRKIIIHEVGGYFCDIVSKLPVELKANLIGVVEDTTFGFNKYKEVEDSLTVPVFHVARSDLKEVEGVFVGEAVVLSFNNIMRGLGVFISGRRALVCGYGMIGKNIAKYLRSSNVQVAVYDVCSIRKLHAFVDGYEVFESKNDLTSFDVIFFATGQNAFSFDEMMRMKDGVVLVSGGSKDIEFDVSALGKAAEDCVDLGCDAKRFVVYVEGGCEKNFVVLRDGTAVNFKYDSVPSEIIDIVFCEILMCIVLLSDEGGEYRSGLQELDEKYLKEIANVWMSLNHVYVN